MPIKSYCSARVSPAEEENNITKAAVWFSNRFENSFFHQKFKTEKSNSSIATRISAWYKSSMVYLISEHRLSEKFMSLGSITSALPLFKWHISHLMEFPADGPQAFIIITFFLTPHSIDNIISLVQSKKCVAGSWFIDYSQKQFILKRVIQVTLSAVKLTVE